MIHFLVPVFHIVEKPKNGQNMFILELGQGHRAKKVSHLQLNTYVLVLQTRANVRILPPTVDEWSLFQSF